MIWTCFRICIYSSRKNNSRNCNLSCKRPNLTVLVTWFTYRFNNTAICKSVSSTDTTFRMNSSPVNSHTIPHPTRDILNCTAPLPVPVGKQPPSLQPNITPDELTSLPQRRRRAGEVTAPAESRKLVSAKAARAMRVKNCTHARISAQKRPRGRRPEGSSSGPQETAISLQQNQPSRSSGSL